MAFGARCTSQPAQMWLFNLTALTKVADHPSNAKAEKLAVGMMVICGAGVFRLVRRMPCPRG